MERLWGVRSIGVRCPIIKEGDNLLKIVCDSVCDCGKNHNLTFNDKDVIAITESVVARSQGNYITCDDISTDIKNKYGDNTIGLIFPILSRNRFSLILKGIARGAKKIVLMLSYPSDEVGNHLISLDMVDNANINPYSDVLSLDDYHRLFGHPVHEFTGIDYVEFYKKIIESENCECDIVFANNAKDILNYTEYVLCCDIHSRFRNKRILKEHGAKVVYGLDDLVNEPILSKGYNRDYGLLGSNKADEERLKLFPRDALPLVEGIQKEMYERTGKTFEVMVYGDGAFKDPQGKIWELADPVVSPFHTSGLLGTPNELKLKYLADNDYKDLKGEELKESIIKSIKEKEKNLVGKMASEGTTPRQITDLLGSLCDLTSGSGDKGTPVILVQGYFDNLTNN